MPGLLDKSLATNAIGLVLPTIKKAMREGVVKRRHLAIVIVDNEICEPISPLVEYFIGGKKNWKHPYDKIAWDKIHLSIRTGFDSGYVISQAPQLLLDYDPPYAGSVADEGFIVACSGVQSYFDEMFARMIAAACKALCQEKMAIEVLPSGRGTVGVNPDLE